jgi:hypothetical protein
MARTLFPSVARDSRTHTDRGPITPVDSDNISRAQSPPAPPRLPCHIEAPIVDGGFESWEDREAERSMSVERLQEEIRRLVAGPEGFRPTD